MVTPMIALKTDLVHVHDRGMYRVKDWQLKQFPGEFKSKY